MQFKWTLHVHFQLYVFIVKLTPGLVAAPQFIHCLKQVDLAPLTLSQLSSDWL